MFALVNLRRFYRPILLEAADRIGTDDALTKVDALMIWWAFGPILQQGLKRSGVGPQGYDPLVLFKRLLIGQRHGLSDPKLERALKVRLDLMLFVGWSCTATCPMRRPIAAFVLRWSKAGFTTSCWLKFAASLRITG